LASDYDADIALSAEPVARMIEPNKRLQRMALRAAAAAEHEALS
jgi:hypothetical protein